tara:strand:+ start:3054 stop:3218 length:165 start_codon:yes stop_codon:yes gene_type:complete
MEEFRENSDVIISTLKEKIIIATQGLNAIIEQSAEISSNRQIAEKTLESMNNCK